MIPMDNAGVPNFTPGEKSREKYLQAEREKNVLAFIFLTRERYYFNKMVKKTTLFIRSGIIILLN